MKIPEYKTKAEKDARTISRGPECLTLADMQEWRIDPDIQRGLTINAIVRVVAKKIAEEKRIPDRMLIGVLNGVMYLLDGQHRREGHRMAVEEYGCPTTVVGEIRWVFCETRAELAMHFELAQRSIVKMRPDDGLRALEHFTPVLQQIRKACPFVGYTRIQRGGPASSAISMANLLRCWAGSGRETPVSSIGAARDVANSLSSKDATDCSTFANLAYRAWDNNIENGSLWGALNLTLCMWLYRQMVLAPAEDVTRITPDQFRRFLIHLTRSVDYIDGIKGMVLSGRNRGLVMGKLEKALSAFLKSEKIVKNEKHVRLPDRSHWVTTQSGR